MNKKEFSKKEKIEILEKNINYIYQDIKKIGNYTLEGLKNASIALINFEKLKKELEEKLERLENKDYDKGRIS